MRTALFALVFVALRAIADTDIIADQETDRAAASYIGGIRANTIVRTDISPGNTSFEWNLVARLVNAASAGENTAFTAQAYKLGIGPTWAGVFEADDSAASGQLYGIEVDAFANGPANGQRQGIMIVVGKRMPAGVAPVIDYGLIITPNLYDDSQGTVDVGVDVRTHCQTACVRVRADERIELSPDPVVGALIFDSKTGFAGFIRRDRFCIWCVQQATGQVLNMTQLP